MLKNAARTAWKIANRAGGVRIRITQSGDVATIDAVPGRTTIDVEESEGTYQSFEDRDFLVLADSLVFDSQVAEVKAGARIEELDSDSQVIATYTARHRGGSKHFEYSDPYHTVVRIHTVET